MRVKGFVVGVEVGPNALRASVFNRGLELVGKMKLSTKPGRGSAAVMERIERCVRYGVDDANLGMDSIVAIGVALPDASIANAGVVSLDGEFEWQAVPLRKHLEASLGLPVVVGNRFMLTTLAVQLMEPSGEGVGVAVFVPGSDLGVGLVVDGEVTDLSEYRLKPGPALLSPGSVHVIHRTANPRFRSFRPRDFRKAIRKGDSAARSFLVESVRKSMRFGARLVRGGVVRHLVLAGGALDENKPEALAEARRVLRSELGPRRAAGIRISISELGDQAASMGAAIFASRSGRPSRTGTRIESRASPKRRMPSAMS